MQMISFTPASVVLRHTGCPAALYSHRFVVLHGPRTLRVLAAGFVGQDQAHLLTVATPNLLVDAGGGGSLGCTVEYQARPSSSANIDDALSGSVRGWLAAYAA